MAPLLLTIASGSDEWRRERRYAHLADRLDVAGILADPTAPGRPYVLHATDETVTEFAIEPYAANAPLHVVALRTATAKYAAYSNWSGESIQPLGEDQDRELYDYRTGEGRLELDNSVGRNPLEDSLRAMLQRAYAQELHRPLPAPLLAARERGFTDYFTVATRVAARATQRRAERELTTARARDPRLGDGLADARTRLGSPFKP